MALSYTINRVSQADIQDVFNLSNDGLVRANSIHSHRITWEEHQQWFDQRIQSADPFYIIRDANHKLVAQVRIDRAKEVIISISISPEYRGKGLSADLFRICSEKSGFKKIFAYVKKENLFSRRMMGKAGYIYISQKDGLLKYQYTKRPVYIVAEISANHGGDKEVAKKMIATAKEMGADAVKMQTYTADTITLNCQNEEFQIKDNDSPWKGENLYHLYQRAYTPWEWQRSLKEYADKFGIDFFSTPFDYSAVDFLENLHVPCYKIASFEAMDYPLIKYAAKFKKPMIISTGVSSLEEIQGAIQACFEVGNRDITLLKCTSAYPAKLADMNLITLQDMINRFGPQGVKIGLSDHSMSNIPPVVAVTLGARIIEKHFTLDRKSGGVDAAFSLEPREFKSLINDIRSAEETLGEIDYTVDEKNRQFARSLYVVKDIKKGEKFTPQNVRSIRPNRGLHPQYYEQVLGKTAKKDYNFATPLKLEDIAE